MGAFGWSNLFLTPQYGARQRLISVITEADLPPAQLMTSAADKGLYLMAFIDFCGKCMHQCPSPEFEYGNRPIERFQDRTGCKTRS